MIFVEDQTIKLNGVVLPGLVKSIEVKESAQIDEQEVEGSSTKPKQATGYEDAKINIELMVDDTETQTKYQRLETLRTVFRKSGQSAPQPIPIICEDTAAHGIEKVLFKFLNHKQENKKSYFSVTLELWEYIPQTIQATKSSSPSSDNGSSPSTASPAESLNSGYSSYLSQRGSFPALTRKKAKSPAVDSADTSRILSKLRGN